MKKTASNAHIWMRCVGYIKAATDFISRYGYMESPAAREGKMAHALAEMLITEMVRTGNPSPKVPDKIDGIVVPVDMKIKVNDYAHLCYSWMRRAMVLGGANLYLEREVACGFLEEDVTTRVDFALFDKKNGMLTVADLKYGHRQVVAEENPQLVIGARAIMDELSSRGERVRNISLNIYQPNGPNASMPLDQWVITDDDLREQSWRVKTLYHMDGSVLTPGRHCRNCEARGGCDAVRAALYEAWDVMAMYNGIPREIPADTLENMMAEMMMFKDLLRGYETGLEALLTSRLKAGETFTHWEYSTSLSDRKWDYPEKDIVEMGRSFGLDLEKKTVLSPKQAEMAGLPKEVVETLVRRDSTGLKLRKKSLKTLREAFQ